MNERIQELIRLSAVPADQAEDYALDKGLVEPTEKLDVAKFAELIVRECAEFADRGTRGGIGELMKKHFGVSE